MEEDHLKRIKEICGPLELTLDQLLMVKNQMMSELKLGLKSEGSDKVPLKCWPTFIQDFPHGCEHGRFLVIHLEDTSFRTYLYQLSGQNEPTAVWEFYEIPQELFEGENMKLFDYISQRLQRFMKKNNLERAPLPLAFVFPFALRHESLTKASLTQYTKRFNFSNLLETDVGNMLKESIKNKNPRVDLVALLNEASAVLLTGSWKNSNCKIGVLIGVNSNVSYVEKTQEIDFGKEDYYSSSMIVHLDWGDFGQNGILAAIRTAFDDEVDKLSENPGLRLFDKMICGNYSAEIARQILVVCAAEGLLFDGEIGRILKIPFSFTIRHMVEVLAEPPDTFDNTRLMFDRLGVMKPNDVECSKVRYILESVTRRSAALLAAGIACLIEQIGDQHISIGMEGSFHRNNLVYQEYVQQFLSQLVGEAHTFELKSTEEGSSSGAAILASITLQHQFVYQGKEINTLYAD